MADVRRWFNCGTALGCAGFLLFCLFALMLIRILCEGPGAPVGPAG